MILYGVHVQIEVHVFLIWLVRPSLGGLDVLFHGVLDWRFHCILMNSGPSLIQIYQHLIRASEH